MAKLYSGFYFLCRQCYVLAYECQRESQIYRLMRKAQKLRLKLGGSPNLMESFPDKPKGMHWLTYLRMDAKADEAETRSLSLMAKWCEKVSGNGLDSS